MRPQMVTRPFAARLRRQRQQTPRMERKRGQHTNPNLQRPHRSSESDRLVASPTRTPSIGWRDSRPLHPLLEHPNRAKPPIGGHWVPSLQPRLVQTLKRARLNPRLLTESNPHMEVPNDDPTGQTHRTQLPCALFGRQP